MKVSIFTRSGKYLFTVDSLEEASIVFDCSQSVIRKAISSQQTFKGYQFKQFRNENDISPSKDYYFRVTTLYILKDRNGKIVDSDNNIEKLAEFYGITPVKLDKAYLDKTFLFKKYSVHKEVTVNTNEVNEFEDFLKDD